MLLYICCTSLLQPSFNLAQYEFQWKFYTPVRMLATGYVAFKIDFVLSHVSKSTCLVRFSSPPYLCHVSQHSEGFRVLCYSRQSPFSFSVEHGYKKCLLILLNIIVSFLLRNPYTSICPKTEKKSKICSPLPGFFVLIEHYNFSTAWLLEKTTQLRKYVKLFENK